MGAAVNTSVNSANVVQALVHTLLDVFDATRDLYNTLRNKERRDRENGYVDARRSSYSDDEIVSDEGIVLDKAAVTRQFDIGLGDIGAPFAVGDVVSQTALQAQIIALQSVIITIFLYGPTSSEPISQQLSRLLSVSREAGTASADVLAAQHHRQNSVRSMGGNVQRAAPYPVTTSASPVPSTTVIKAAPELSSSYPAKATILSLRDGTRSQRSRTVSSSSSSSSSLSGGGKSTPQTSFCLYARDLQHDPSLPLSSTITDSSSPYCPYCRRILKLSPGKTWEIFKHDGPTERRFRIQNRFIAKCHRDSPDGGYSCVLCSHGSSVETICGDVGALVRHVWMDHEVGELKHEEDVVEVVDDVSLRRRRDSLVSLTEAKRSVGRRSVSVGPRRERERSVGRRRWVEGGTDF